MCAGTSSLRSARDPRQSGSVHENRRAASHRPSRRRARAECRAVSLVSAWSLYACSAIETPPIGAPLAAALTAAFAPHVLHGAYAANQQRQELAKRCLVIRATDRPGGGAEGDRPRDVNEKKATYTPGVAAEISRCDLPRVPKRERTCNGRRQQSHHLAC